MFGFQQFGQLSLTSQAGSSWSRRSPSWCLGSAEPRSGPSAATLAYPIFSPGRHVAGACLLVVAVAQGRALAASVFLGSGRSHFVFALAAALSCAAYAFSYRLRQCWLGAWDHVLSFFWLLVRGAFSVAMGVFSFH